MEFPINNINFNITSKFDDIQFNDDQRALLNQPSNMTRVVLISSYSVHDASKHKYRLLDFTGTTVEQAIRKILTFYRHKTYRRLIGDHMFFERFDNIDGDAVISVY